MFAVKCLLALYLVCQSDWTLFQMMEIRVWVTRFYFTCFHKVKLTCSVLFKEIFDAVARSPHASDAYQMWKIMTVLPAKNYCFCCYLWLWWRADHLSWPVMKKSGENFFLATVVDMCCTEVCQNCWLFSLKLGTVAALVLVSHQYMFLIVHFQFSIKDSHRSLVHTN